MAPHDMSRGSNGPTRTLGIDLASQPRRTALCLIEWTGRTGTVLPAPSERLTDPILIREISDPRVAKVGIDAPFGWPQTFVDAVNSFRADLAWPECEAKDLEFRRTERRIADQSGTEPLSAVTDWLVWPTLRCARLLSALTEIDPAPRSGDGRIVEVYPAAALARWDLSPAAWIENPGSYKGDQPGRLRRRELLVELIAAETKAFLDLVEPARFVASDDELDALVCALVARTGQRNLLESIPEDSRDAAAAEGWLRLPVAHSGLESLA